MVHGMPTHRTTLTLDADAMDLARRVASRHGMSLSAFVSRAMRREAIRLGAPPVVDVETEAAAATAHEQETAAALAHEQETAAIAAAETAEHS